MGTISVSLPSDGETADAADYNVPINTIVSAINGSLDSNNISASGIVPNNLATGTGTSWAWQSYTPTFANTTLGNGTVVGKYIQIGKTVFFRASFVLGNTSAVSTTPTVTLPVTSVALATPQPIGLCTVLDSGTNNFYGFIRWTTTTTCTPIVFAASGSYTSDITFTSTVPMTWTTNDAIYVQGTYEAA